MVGMAGRSGGARRPCKLKHNLETNPIPKPEVLSDRASEIWDELIERLPASILEPIDAYQVAILVNLLWQSESLIELLKTNPGDQKSLRLFHQNCQSINRLSALFGLSPMDRARMTLEPENTEPDPFLDYLKMIDSTRMRT